MRQFTLEDLKKPKQRKPKKVPIDKDSFAFVLNPSPDQADLAQMQFQAFKAETNGKVGFTRFLVAWSLCDETNDRLVDSGDAEDSVSKEFLDALQCVEQMEYRPCKAIFDAAMHTFGMSDADVKELEKNCEATVTDDGSGCKPSTTA